MAVPGIFGQTVETYEVCYVTEILAFMIIGLVYTDKLAEHLAGIAKMPCQHTSS